MRRWHHGHSLGAGLLAGVFFSHDTVLVFLAGLAVGAAATVAILGGYRLAKTLLAAFEAWRDNSRAKREKIRTDFRPIYHGRDEIPY